MMLTASFAANFFAIIALLGAMIYCYFKYSHSYWKRRGISSLPAHWFFGNMKDTFQMKRPAGYMIGDLYQQGTDKDDVLGIYILHMPFLIIRNPEIIKQILVKEFNLFPDRYFSAKSIYDKVGSSSLFTINNPEWKHLRAKMSPAFSSGKIKKLFYLMVETSNTMEEYLKSVFSNGHKTQSVLVKDVITKYTTDIISSVAFGIRTNSFNPDEAEFLNKSSDLSRNNILRALRFMCMFFLPQIGKYVGGSILRNHTDYFRRIFWNSMDTREASNTKRGDLIDSLVELKKIAQQTNGIDDFKFEDDTYLAQSAIFFVAGRESSVSTITFGLFELAKQPHLQTRLREEILEKINEFGMTYEAVQEMKYLNQVISEVLRMYPAAPILDRMAAADCKIPGTNISVEKGTPVYIPLCGLHYDPKYHPDPTRFDPDRFSDERKHEIVPFTYMPFGEGPRACIAARVGQLQSSMGLITIIKNYEVSLDPSYNVKVDTGNVFTSPPEGLRLNFTKLS